MFLTRHCYHEAAHCLAFAQRGVPVVELSADVLGGFCSPLSPHRLLSPVEAAFVALAGSFGPRVIGDFDDSPSYSDLQMVGESHLFASELAVVNRQLGEWVFEHAEQIRYLGAALLRTGGHLDAGAIADLFHAPGAPVGEYRSLYSIATRPKLTKTFAPGVTPPSFDEAKWSEEHQCYLGPRPQQYGVLGRR